MPANLENSAVAAGLEKVSFSRGRLGGLVFPSLEEFSTVDCGKSKALA